MLTNPPIPYNIYVGDPISHVLTVLVIASLAWCFNRFLSVKALVVVGAFNQEKVPVKGISVTINFATVCFQL